MLINTRIFSGERPKLSNRNLATSESELALDCRLVSGDVEPLCGPLATGDQVSTDAKVIVLFEGMWFSFDEDVSVIESKGRLFWTGPDGARQATKEQLQAGQSHAMGVPKPTQANDYTVAGTETAGSLTVNTAYIVTYVNEFGEEGDRSEVSDNFDINPGQTLTINGLNQDPMDIADHGIKASRIYVLSEGSFKFAAEIVISDSDFTFTWGDLTLAETFSTDDYDLPPTGLSGLHLTANNVALGFVPGSNLIYATEINSPNAWRHFFPVDDEPVAISSYDNNAVILTKGHPEVATINDPINIVPVQLTYREPCQAVKSVVQGMGGVIYASDNGLFYIGRGAGRLLTEEFIDRKDWAKYAPSTMRAVFKDGQYIGFHKGFKEGNAIIFDSREPNGVIRQLSLYTEAALVEDGSDNLFYAEDGFIFQMEAGEDLLEYTWRSKLFGNGSPHALTSARVLTCEHVDNNYIAGFSRADEVIAERLALIQSGVDLGGVFGSMVFAGCGDYFGVTTAIPLGGSILPPVPVDKDYTITLEIFGDKELIDTINLVDDEVCRIAYATRKRYWQYEIKGRLAVQQVDLATSNSEMFTGA